jgi:hypothetical protein
MTGAGPERVFEESKYDVCCTVKDIRGSRYYRCCTVKSIRGIQIRRVRYRKGYSRNPDMTGDVP